MSEPLRRVIVVGSGIAGTAAALTLRAHAPKLDVNLVLGAAGATVLANGALDGRLPTSEAARTVLRELAYCTYTDGALVATTAGVLRPAKAIDTAVLNIAAFENTTILLPRANHATWDADYLASALEATPEAKARRLRFLPVDARVVRETDELTMSDGELARKNSSPTRVAWLASQLHPLRAQFPESAAILLPPWLPIHTDAQDALREQTGMALGEATGLPTGPAGLRFLRARDAALAAREVHLTPGFVARITRENEALAVTLVDETVIGAAAVILATGGIIAGGIQYGPAELRAAGELPVESTLPFELTYNAPVTLGANGMPLLLPGSLFGIAPESMTWPFVENPMFERVGVLTENHLAGSGIFACGDAEADSSRQWLDALEGGTRAALATLLVV